MIALPDDLPRGTQTLSYRVVSQDGHPVAGTMMFSIGAATRGVVEASGYGPVPVLIWLTRIGAGIKYVLVP